MAFTTATQLLKVVRLHIVAGGVLAFTVGALLAAANGGILTPLPILWFYAIVLLGDLSTHYGNDYFDADCDVKFASNKFFSGKKILSANPNLLSQARKLSLMLLLVSVLASALAVALQFASAELLLITLGANFLGWFYSAPPLRLVSRGLGELAIALAVGFAIPAVGYLSVKGQLDGFFALFAVPFILFGFILALSLQAPDIEVDCKTGKNNIGARKGERAIFGGILAAAISAFAFFLSYAWLLGGSAVDLLVVAALSTLPLACSLAGFAVAIRKQKTDIFSTANIFALFILNILMVAYLALSLIG